MATFGPQPDPSLGPQTDTSYSTQTVQPQPTTSQPTQQQQQPQGPQQAQWGMDETSPIAVHPSAPGGAKPAAPEGHHIFRSLMETLAGPKYSYKINPDGTQEAVRVPQSKSQLANSIVAGALTGLFQGAQEHGPGAATRAFGKGGQAAVERNQQMDQQARQTAQQDFARKAGVVEANMRALNNAIQVGRLDKEDHDTMVESQAQQLQDYKENSPDVVGGEHLSEEDSKDMKKYPLGDWIRVPDGTVPRIDPNTGEQLKINGVRQWDNTYTMIHSGAKTGLTDDDGEPKSWLKSAVDWGLKDYPESILKASPTSQVSAAAASKAQHQVVMLQTLQGELNGFTKELGVDPIDLKKAVHDNPSLVDAVQHFQRAAGGATRPDQQLQLMRSDPKSAPYVGTIQALFGIQNMQDYADKVEAKKKAAATAAETTERVKAENAERMANPKTPVDAQEVISASRAGKPITPAALAQAQGIINQDLQYSNRKAYGEAMVKQQVEQAAEDRQNTYLQTPANYKYDPNIRNLDLPGVEDMLRKQGVKVPDNLGDLWAVARNDDSVNHALPTRISAKSGQMDTQRGLTFIKKFLNPDHREYDFPAAQDFAKELGSGKVGTSGGSILSSGTAVQHIALMDQAYDALHNGRNAELNNIAKKLGTATGGGAEKTFDAIAEQVNGEVGKVVAGSTPREAELAELRGSLSHKVNPNTYKGVSQAYRRLMGGRITEINEKSQQLLNRPARVPDEVTRSFMQNGIETPWVQTAEQAQQQASGARPNTVNTGQGLQPIPKPQGTVGTVQGRDGNLYWTDGKKSLGLAQVKAQ